VYELTKEELATKAESGEKMKKSETR